MKNHILIFDFDGTIADTYHYIIEISNRLSREFNYSLIEEGDTQQIKDKTSQEIIKYLKVPVLKIPAIIARAKKEYYKELTRLEPIKNLKEVLQEIKGFGETMGICSSNSRKNVVNFLENHSLNIFDFVHTTSRVWSKNASLKKLIQTYGYDKERVVYIGDETRDVTAAQKLGIKVAAVSWGYNSAKALKALNPDYLISTPADLLKMCREG